MDTRREVAHIQREMERYQNTIGENVVWYMFDPDASTHDTVYDEGGKVWKPGVNVPVLWIDQAEAPEQYTPEGKRPVQTLRFSVMARAIIEVHIGLQEAHGHRLYDRGLIQGRFFDDRNNDIVYYDGRFWEVARFDIKGRAREDSIVGVTCSEVYAEDEMRFDWVPGTAPPV